MILSWGKCGLSTAPSTGGEPGASATWTDIDTPKKDTTKLTSTVGEEITAQEEGGEIVDARYGKTTYTLEFDIFVKKGGTRPFTDDDGIISGEHAFRVVPLEDTSCEGIQIDRSVVYCEQSYSTADGLLLHYVAKCLKPKTGMIVKPYTAAGV